MCSYFYTVWETFYSMYLLFTKLFKFKEAKTWSTTIHVFSVPLTGTQNTWMNILHVTNKVRYRYCLIICQVRLTIACMHRDTENRGFVSFNLTPISSQLSSYSWVVAVCSRDRTKMLWYNALTHLKVITTTKRFPELPDFEPLKLGYVNTINYINSVITNLKWQL